jgi:hypothetical protein
VGWLCLLEIEVQYNDPIPFQQPHRIVVTMGMLPDADPRSATRTARVDTRIGSALDVPGMGPLIEGKRVNVEVRYIVRQP